MKAWVTWTSINISHGEHFPYIAAFEEHSFIKTLKIALKLKIVNVSDNELCYNVKEFLRCVKKYLLYMALTNF